MSDPELDDGSETEVPRGFLRSLWAHPGQTNRAFDWDTAGLTFAGDLEHRRDAITVGVEDLYGFDAPVIPYLVHTVEVGRPGFGAAVGSVSRIHCRKYGNELQVVVGQLRERGDVMTIERLGGPAHNLHVLPRHHLLPQPQRFEGLLTVEEDLYPVDLATPTSLLLKQGSADRRQARAQRSRCPARSEGPGHRS